MSTEVAKLSDTCLKNICTNFDRYNTAYLNSENEEMKMNFVFLQRSYSSEVIKMLMAQRADIFLEKKYFDLLINKYLKKLNFRIFGKDDLDYVLEVLLPEMGDTLETVTFNFNSTVTDHLEPYLTKFVKNALLHLPNVQEMKMKHSSSCDDNTLELIYSSCKELKVLELYGGSVTSTGLKNLCPEDKKDNLFNLQNLSINFYMKESDEGVAYLLQNLPSLKSIYCDNLGKVLHKLHVDDLRNSALANVTKYNLKVLYIEAMDFDNDMEKFEETLVIAAELCPRISDISVSDIMTERQLKLLCKFSDLIDVDISGQNTTLDVSEFLQYSGKKIRKLEIDGLKLSVSSLVKFCPNLESIDLGDNYYYACEKEKRVNILPKVRKLSFIGIQNFNERTEMYVEQVLDSCPNLGELEFSASFCDELSDVIQKYCEKSEMLKALTFTFCNVDEALLRHIALSCTPLKMLTIRACRNISFEEIENLRAVVRDRKCGVIFDFSEMPDGWDDEDVDEMPDDGGDDEDVDEMPDDGVDDEDVDEMPDDGQPDEDVEEMPDDGRGDEDVEEMPNDGRDDEDVEMPDDGRDDEDVYEMPDDGRDDEDVDEMPDDDWDVDH